MTLRGRKVHRLGNDSPEARHEAQQLAGCFEIARQHERFHTIATTEPEGDVAAHRLHASAAGRRMESCLARLNRRLIACGHDVGELVLVGNDVFEAGEIFEAAVFVGSEPPSDDEEDDADEIGLAAYEYELATRPEGGRI